MLKSVVCAQFWHLLFPELGFVSLVRGYGLEWDIAVQFSMLWECVYVL